MLVFPCCKINLGLHVTERRPDGYHNLETLFYPIPLEDVLEVVPLSGAKKQSWKLTLYGNSVAGNAEQNLVVKAYRLLAYRYDLPAVDIHLYKHIPSGAGLGGGSSDAAYMLLLLNDLFQLHLSVSQLEVFATDLGADCAFFIRHQPVFAEGIGNLFTPVSLSLHGYRIVIVKPDIFVSTPEAFRGLTPQKPTLSLKEVACQPVNTWRTCMTNDFEKTIFPIHPKIESLKKQLYEAGAIYASMSGSGSAVFGLFEANAPLPSRTHFPNAFYFSCTL